MDQPLDAQRKRLPQRVLARLEAAYGRRSWRHWGSAVEVLVGTILSQNTSDANSSAGYRQLRRRFRSWRALADASVREVEQAIRVSGLSRIKAPRIQAILRAIRDAHGAISLEFLRDWPPQEAYEYLLRFDGVGPKTAACVLLFAFGKQVFPVDTHILRIAVRLGLVGPRTGAKRCQELLTPLIRPGDRYATHVLLIEHGRKVCRAGRPRCDWCDLLDLCPHGKGARGGSLRRAAPAAGGRGRG